MVSRQFAARCQLPDAELFQEGCLGLPACQLPTGSSRCTCLGANSSIMLRSYSSIVSIQHRFESVQTTPIHRFTATSSGIGIGGR
jgi:hypothetical protein